MVDSPPNALEVRGLSVSYGPVKALQSVDIVVPPGKAVAVIGSNGAGKTSMLKGIMRLVPAESNGIALFGEAIDGLSTHRIARKHLGYVPEGRELFPGLSVREELLIGGQRLTPERRRRKMEEMFALFPRLQERERQISRTLSGGEQQMLAIARTLMGEPRLLLLDEPSLGLAPVIQDVVYAALAELRVLGLSMLLVEQNAYRALKLCDRAYVLELGSITRQGNSEQLIEDDSIREAYLGRA